jgi:dienelactone hydrolase
VIDHAQLHPVPECPEDLKKITVPVLVMHGDDDQIVPYADSGPLSAKLVKNGGPAEAERLDVVLRAGDGGARHDVAPVTAIAVTGQRPENLDAAAAGWPGMTSEQPSADVAVRAAASHSRVLRPEPRLLGRHTLSLRLGSHNGSHVERRKLEKRH